MTLNHSFLTLKHMNYVLHKLTFFNKFCQKYFLPHTAKFLILSYLFRQKLFLYGRLCLFTIIFSIGLRISELVMPFFVSFRCNFCFFAGFVCFMIDFFAVCN